MKTKNLIDVKNLSVSFGNNIILNKVNLHLSKKESLVIIGKSGSGKSVLLKCLMGLLKPNLGSIKIDGVDIANSNITMSETQVSRQIIYVSSNFDCLLHCSD